MLLGGMADTLEDKAARLTAAVEQLSAGTQETSAGAGETANHMHKLASVVE